MSILKNDIVIDGPDLDIYAAIELRNILVSLLKTGTTEVALNLEKVTSLSIPAVQVILSAYKSFERFRIEKDTLKPSLLEEFKSLGIEA